MATAIEWTRGDDGRSGETWNPVTGCTKVSQGCKHCYAERDFHRPYPGRDFTDIRFHWDRLYRPLKWKRPRRIFVSSMSDLFHDEVDLYSIVYVFAVMALAVQHQFIVLTKRPRRFLEVQADLKFLMGVELKKENREDLIRWPLPNVWMGVSVEDQETADERIPLLLQAPAAVRFISAEPLLGDVRLGSWLHRSPSAAFTASKVTADMPVWTRLGSTAIDWVIVGGESGPKARPCDVGWIRGLVGQCRDAGVPVFVKQLGACTTGWCFGNRDSDGVDCSTSGFSSSAIGCQTYEASEGGDCPDGQCCLRRDRKGGDPTEWPADLRVREFPGC